MHSAIFGINIGDSPATGGMVSDRIDSYSTAVGNYLDMLERFRGQLSAGQYERDKPFFTELRDLLGKTPPFHVKWWAWRTLQNNRLQGVQDYESRTLQR